MYASLRQGRSVPMSRSLWYTKLDLATLKRIENGKYRPNSAHAMSSTQSTVLCTQSATDIIGSPKRIVLRIWGKVLDIFFSLFWYFRITCLLGRPCHWRRRRLCRGPA